MHRDLFLRIGLVVVGTLFTLNLIVSLFQTSASSHAAATVQYKILQLPFAETAFPDKIQARLDQLGKEGWELVSADFTSHNYLIFKK